jgi:hypothetical protein
MPPISIQRKFQKKTRFDSVFVFDLTTTIFLKRMIFHGEARLEAILITFLATLPKTVADFIKIDAVVSHALLLLILILILAQMNVLTGMIEM